MHRSIGRQIADSLVAHEVDTVFCVPGESYLGLTDALLDVADVKLVVCRHESGAGFMAIADGQLAGRPGVCLVSRGPGASNVMIALHTAFHDAKPLVVIVGHVELKDIGRGALQEQNYPAMLGDVTKTVIEVIEPSQASDAIARAFHLAESGTPGPVAVIVTEDMFDAVSDDPVQLPRPRSRTAPSETDLHRTADLLRKAERPLIWVGGALDRKAARATLETFAEKWHVPICPTNRHPHLFDCDHPNYGGYIGIRVPARQMEVMKKADLLLVLGERLTDTTSQSYGFPAAPQPQLPLVHVWPDDNEVGRVWRPEIGIACEPAILLELLAARDPGPQAAGRDGWIAALNAAQREVSAPVWDETDDGLNMAAVFVEAARHIARDGVITSDAGTFASFLHRYVGFHRDQHFLSSVVGAMGSGVPMAVSAAIRQPDRQTVCFVGDGGALMTGNEIATAILHGAAPIIIICDNGNYGSISLHHDRRYPGRPYERTTRLANPDFALWARSFGAEGFTIRDEQDLAPVMEEAFRRRDKPTIVHAFVSARQLSAWYARKPESETSGRISRA